MASSVCSSSMSTVAVIDAANADIATPHRVTFIGVSPARPDEENVSTSRKSAAAPAAAISGRPNGSDEPEGARQHHRQRRPGIQPQDMRLAERVADHGLQQHARDAEGRARHQGGAEPQQPQPDDDAMVEIARVEVEECVYHRLRGDNARPDAQVRNRAHRQQQQRKEQERPERCASWLLSSA